MCLKARAAAAAESSDVPMPLMRISMTEGRIEGPLGAESSHFEYAPIVKHTEILTYMSHVVQKETTEKLEFSFRRSHVVAAPCCNIVCSSSPQRVQKILSPFKPRINRRMGIK